MLHSDHEHRYLKTFHTIVEFHYTNTQSLDASRQPTTESAYHMDLKWEVLTQVVRSKFP